MALTYSKDGISLTESFESCALKAYRDVKGVWTIGWGHTGLSVIEGLTCTQQQADDWLDSDIAWAANVVNTLVKVPLTQDEFDALVDFVFNVGTTAFHNSTMLRLLNRSMYHAAAQQFDLWDHASGKVVAGLLRRRIAETTLFEKGDQ